MWRLTRPDSVIHFEPGMEQGAGLRDHPSAVPLRPADRRAGHRDEHRAACCCCGSSARSPQSAAAQAAYAVGYTELFSLITWTSVGLMGAAATIAGQNLGAGARIASARACGWRRGSGCASRPGVGALFLADPGTPARRLRHDRSGRAVARRAAAAYPERVGPLRHAWRSASPAGCRERATRAARSTSRSSRRSSSRSACARAQATARPQRRRHLDWRSCSGHVTRCALSVGRFRQQKWRAIRVAMPA